MPTISYAVAVGGGGTSINENVNRTPDGADSRVVALPIAQGGVLTTRTNATAGTLTMNTTNHGIVNAAIIDIFVAGAVNRYGVVVGTVSGNSVPFSGGSGANLAVVNSVVAASTQQQINLAITGSLLSILAIMPSSNDSSNSQPLHVDFQDSGNASVTTLSLNANTPQVFDVTGGSSNPFTGNAIGRLMAANGDLVNTATLTVIVGQDSTP